MARIITAKMPQENDDGVWGLKVRPGLFSPELTKLFNARVRRRVKAHKRWGALQIYALETTRRAILYAPESYYQQTFGAEGEGPSCSSPECVMGHIAWGIECYKREKGLVPEGHRFCVTTNDIEAEMKMSKFEVESVFDANADTWARPYNLMYAAASYGKVSDIYYPIHDDEALALSRKIRAKIAGMYVTYMLTTGKVKGRIPKID